MGANQCPDHCGRIRSCPSFAFSPSEPLAGHTAGDSGKAIENIGLLLLCCPEEASARCPVASACGTRSQKAPVYEEGMRGLCGPGGPRLLGDTLPSWWLMQVEDSTWSLQVSGSLELRGKSPQIFSILEGRGLSVSTENLIPTQKEARSKHPRGKDHIRILRNF